MLSSSRVNAPALSIENFDVFNVMGVRLIDVPREDLADIVVQDARQHAKTLIVNANAHCMVLAQKSPWIRQLFQTADIAFCDGAGVQLASLFLVGRRLHRTTPPEWIGGVLEKLGSEASIFWLGGSQEAVVKAAQTYKQRYGSQIAGVRNGFFDATKGSPDSEAILQEINAAKPTFLFVNMGMPRQEKWLWDNWSRLPNTIAVTAGALVDHAAGTVRRPPRWVANLGLEWFVRLTREPKRLWKRYLIGLPVFGYHVLSWKIRNLLKRSDPKA
ncbi:WecB/TagA/CpsF family glycosyltransferase [Kozakia baliensis]|uniref:WecB/TagA/CpsF family glycosyltransferase n=1 Tax=Kozakia baliensis TaxID=153496 RepID=UPI0004967F9D|nr:WecB/TagA/CpsF family glycosyltransferase [Kozakia baliensis]